MQSNRLGNLPKTSPQNPHSLWAPKLVSFVLAGLAALSAVYWVMQWYAQQSLVTGAHVAQEPPAATPDLLRLLGRVEGGAGSNLAAVAGGRFALTGVVAGLNQGGTALISVDGKLSRTYKVGDTVDGSLYLQSVAKRSATLADRAAPGAAFTTLDIRSPDR